MSTEIASPAAAAAAATTNAGEKKARTPKPKRTFMLHSADDFSCLSKFSSSDPRYAALKAASRGHTKILLRETNSKIIMEYTGGVLQLDTPAVIKRGDREVVYNSKPVSKFLRRWVYSGDIDGEDADVEELELPKPPE